MQFRPVVSAILINCTQTQWLLYDILLIIISTACSEAMLFLAACYLGGNCMLLLLEFYTVYEIAV